MKLKIITIISYLCALVGGFNIRTHKSIAIGLLVCGALIMVYVSYKEVNR